MYTCNEQCKNNIKKTNLFIVAQKRMKHLRVNLTKEMKNIYSKTTKC